MCRYGFHIYKPRLACFSCRKALKRVAFDDYLRSLGKEHLLTSSKYSFSRARPKSPGEKALKLQQAREQYLASISTCSDCGEKMGFLGFDFRPPKRSDFKAWNRVRTQHRWGKRFLSCGCNGPGFIPTSQVEFRDYISEVVIQYAENIERWIASRDSDPTEREEGIQYWKSRLLQVDLEREQIKLNSQAEAILKLQAK